MKILPIALVAVGFVAGGVYAMQAGLFSDGPSTTVAERFDSSAYGVTEMVQGDPDAVLEVVEYASFTCPHCASFHANQYVQLKTDYIDTDRIRFVYREVYFDRPGIWASMLARCGGEMRFFGIANLLYEQQREWLAGGQDPALINQNLRRIGISAGMTGDQIEACMTDSETAEGLVAWSEAAMTEYGVRSTPSFVINGELYTNMAYDEFAALLDAQLEALGE